MRRDQLVAATQRTSANSKLGILHLYGTTNVKRIGHIIFCLINMPINLDAEIQFYCNQHRRHCILRRAGAGGPILFGFGREQIIACVAMKFDPSITSPPTFTSHSFK